MKKIEPQSARRAYSMTVEERIGRISNQRKQTIAWFLILLSLVPTGNVQAADDPAWALLSQVQPGVYYDAYSQSWFFYGVPVEQVRYAIPGASIDLVRLLFIGRDGIPFKVWVAVGMDIGSDYLPLGPWDTPEQAQTIRLRETLLRIYISETEGTLHPEVDETGIRWGSCDPQAPCSYGQFFDAMHNDLSNLFIEYEIAPGWYPWGFLFWDVEIVAQREQQTDIPDNILRRME